MPGLISWNVGHECKKGGRLGNLQEGVDPDLKKEEAQREGQWRTLNQDLKAGLLSQRYSFRLKKDIEILFP